MKKQRKATGRVTRGSGNVFADLGFKADEAAELQVKAELTRQIYHRIRDLRLTQTQAAARLGISQPDVSKLMNARFTGYSTDRLIALLSALAVDVEIIVRPHPTSSRRERGIVRIRQAVAV
jgi:predicted XRE-type DNA-binding protein